MNSAGSCVGLQPEKWSRGQSTSNTLAALNPFGFMQIYTRGSPALQGMVVRGEVNGEGLEYIFRKQLTTV